MSQEPSVLLVDLPDKGAPFAQALSQVGRQCVFIAVDQVSSALERGQPLGIVALARDVSQIAEFIRAQNYPHQLPFFVLQADAPGSIRPPLPEVTAVVPEGVEPGILALRIQQALQQIGGPRPRQTTVLGIGSMSKPPEMASPAPSTPQATLVVPGEGRVRGSGPPPIPSTPPGPPAIPSTASTPPATASAAPAIPSAPPEVPWNDAPEPGIVSSAPPVVPKSQPSSPRSSVKPVVVSSAPPLPDIHSLTPSAPFIPEAAPLPAEVQKTLGELSSSPASSPPANPSAEYPRAESAPTHPPVALNPFASASESSAEWEDELGKKKRSWGPRALVAAGLLAALGVGGVVVSRGASEGAEDDTKKSASIVTPPPSSTTDAAPHGSKVDSKVGATEEVPSGTGPGATAASAEATGEAAFYKIGAAATMETCEKALGKSAADFASAKKWRAAQSWKQARKSLMAGQEDVALKHMCEASFIDASGPATIGLAKYYLGRRGLEEAHSWASKAVDAASGANSKRSAQQVLGDVLSQMGKVEEARSVWLQSFNLTADQADRLAPVVRNFVSAAVKARKGGDPRLAEQLLRRATTFEPDNVNASALLAATLLENGEKKLAKAWAERALLKKPGLEMAEEVLKSLGG